MALNIFIDTSSRTLLSSQSGGTPIQGTSLPLFYPDTIQLNVYLLQPIANAAIGNANYQSIPTAGIELLLYLDGGSEGSPILSQVTNFQSDASGTYFIGTLALNTAAIKQPLGTAKSLGATLKIGSIVGGNTTTYIATGVTIMAGMPAGGLIVPPGLTPLSLQAAEATFVPINGLPAGQGFYLVTPNGKKLYLQAIDEPDGTASFVASPVN